jgi:hypothetical protein
MLKLVRLFFPVLLLSLLISHRAVIVGRAVDKSELLKPYLSCKSDDGLYVKEVTQRSKSAENYRTVRTAGGEKKVSVVDGYRVMFAYEKAHYFFANVKIEQSKVQEYASDKEAIIESIKYLPFYENVPAKMVYRGKSDFNGYEVYGADMDVIDKGGVLGIYVIFSNTDNVIVTVYFLNQGREHRRFSKIEEFRSLRDNFLNRYTRCINEAKDR